jgi:hypothetical protein
MDPNEFSGWTEIVTANDIDQHMASIGQAEVNAHLVAQMLQAFPLKKGSSLLIPAAGTGQMFDYVEPAQIGDYHFTFTDLNLKFLEKLEARLTGRHLEYIATVDDIEATKLSGNYEGILSVLLLQHIDWKKGIDSMLGFSPRRMYLVIQEQTRTGHAISKERVLAPSIEKFAQIANPCLVPRKELTDYLGQRNYQLLRTYEREVPDNKSMVGLVFERS